MVARLTDFVAGARASVARARVIARVARSTGLVDQLRPRGLVALAKLRGKRNASAMVRYHAANDPTRTALVAGARRYSYFELDALMDGAARSLAASGFRPGEAAIVMLKNVAEAVILQGGIGRAGGAVVCASWRSTPSELDYLLENSRACAIFLDAAAARAHADVLERHGGRLGERVVAVGGDSSGTRPYADFIQAGAAGQSFEDHSDDASVIIYTSGTTGKPKGAVRRHDNKDAAVQVLSFIGATPLSAAQTHLAVMPLYHSTAFAFVTLSFLMGSTVVLAETFDPASFLDSLERHRVDHTAVVPTMLHRTLELGRDAIRRRDLSSLKAIISGGAPLSAQVAERTMDAFGDKLYNFYGATETGFVTLAPPSDLRAAPGTIGRPIPGNEIVLLDDDGRPVGPDEVGELYVKSGNLVAGYHANPAATAESMREGFFSVGDLARVDARGYYFLEGRKRDLIISGGVNVYPREVEAVLAAHPSVGEAAVIGLADEEWGERVHAFVVAASGVTASEEEILQHCREHLAGPKRPRGITFLDELPRNPTGKVLKRDLRTRPV
jgi:fatty-acyl-CoA synthase